MPRLLLVDDNPSIHRIAESLLTPTDIELTCADSAEEALDRIERGERFDVALVDTAMPGMDGWTLLTRLRAMEATAQIPIALMAGVLDPVDPAKLAKAPVQGFLKKPIELRELGDRVKALLATPVVTAPSPFSTLPATSSKELVRRAEAGLPEYRPEPELDDIPEPQWQAPVMAAAAEEPVVVAPAEAEPPLAQDDLLLLDAEDLWPEESPVAAVASVPAPPDVQLELEELDLESLQDLAMEPLSPVPPPPAPDLAALEPVEVEAAEPDLAATALAALREDDEALVTLSGLEELDVLAGVPPMAPAPSDLVLAAASVVSAADRQGPAVEGQPGATSLAQAALPAPMAPPPAEPSVPLPLSSVDAQQTQALLHALMAEPVLMDALVKALVARMGDQVLREVAWEVMPDLAGRLQR